MFNRITIIGLGLIGGSLALAIKEKKLAREIIGISRRKSTIDFAVKKKIVNFATVNLKDGVKNSDLVIIAAPVFKIVDIANALVPFLKDSAILTDAGSTKKYIIKNIEKTGLESLNFVGSHPIAGSEKSGIKYADKDLFKGAYCVLTKTRNTNPKSLSKIKKFWEKLGMKIIVMSSEAHDRLLSRISHLPHAVSASLVNSVGVNRLDLAAGGFRDTTRIASGEPELWKDIFLTNRENLVKDIEIFKKELLKIEAALKNNNSQDLLRLLSKAKSIRDVL
ncbi:MAG: prephenate dehydrogenase [Candidatus Omnitrophica bacterium]|nr:prephenate dehydrogenase [Candidatus Omnitrophota bacterium]